MYKTLQSLITLLLFTCSLHAQTVDFNATGGNYDCGENTICSQVLVSNFDSINNLQFSLNWNPAILTFSSFDSELPSTWLTDEQEIADGKIGFLWTYASGLATSLTDESPIIEICFEPQTSSGTTMIEFDDPLIVGGLIEVSGVRDGQFIQDLPRTFSGENIIIGDFAPPTLSCPNDTLIMGSNGTIVGNISPDVMDACSPLTVDYTLLRNGMAVASGSDDASNSSFDVGTTTVRYDAFDFGGNDATCSFDVIIEGASTSDMLEFIPVTTVNCLNNTATMSLVVNNFVDITSLQMGIRYNDTLLQYVDNVRVLEGPGSLNTTFSSDEVFYTWAFPATPTENSATLPNGSTILTITFNILNPLSLPLFNIEDFQDNTPISIADQNGILVEGTDYIFPPEQLIFDDILAPTIECPDDVIELVEASMDSAQVFNLTPTFSDNCSEVTLSYTRSDGVSGNGDASGTYFPVGTTTLTYTATDQSGLSRMCEMLVTVERINEDLLEFKPILDVNCEDGTVIYRLLVDEFTDIVRFQVGVRYDTSALEFVNAVKEIPGGGGNPTADLSPNHVWISWSNSSPYTAPNGTNFLTITFNLIGEINPPLTILESIGAGLDVLVEDNMGVLTENIDFLLKEEQLNVPSDTVGPVFEQSCEDILVGNDTGRCNALVTLPFPSVQDYCSGIANRYYEIDGTQTTIADSISSEQITLSVGTHLVTYIAEDGSGNTSQCEINITVQDREAPQVFCSSLDVFPNDPGTCTALVAENLRPDSIQDNCGINTISYAMRGGRSDVGNGFLTSERFPVGTTYIDYTISDNAGNVGTCTIEVTVGDTEVPVLNCPEDIFVTIPSTETETVVILDPPTGSDNCTENLTFGYIVDGIPFVADEPKAVTFQVGVDTVTATMTDGTSTIECTFLVTVSQGDEPQLIDCPSDVNSCTAIVSNIDPIYLEDESQITLVHEITSNGNSISGNGSASGNTFMPGENTVRYIASGMGIQDTCEFVVNIDNIGPTFTSCSDDITIYTSADSCGVTVNWTEPIANDDCGILAIEPNIENGTFFATGQYDIIYAAIDSAGNQSTCSFQVAVLDTIAPQVSNCDPDDLVVTQLTSSCGATATWTPPFTTDNCPVNIVSNFEPGDTFYITTTVIYTITDEHNNETVCAFIIPVENEDNLPPVISNCPSDTTLYLTPGACTIAYFWEEPTISDACSDAFIDSPNFTPGDSFELGVTEVGYIGFDTQGQSASCNFNVTVLDTIAPEISCPSTILDFASTEEGCGTIIDDFDIPMATDNCDDNVMVVCSHNPGDFFNVGLTTVTCRAIDNSNNVDSCTFSISVTDQFVPQIACPGDIIANVDGTIVSGSDAIINSIIPNGSCDSVTVRFNAPIGVDNCTSDMPQQVEGPMSGDRIAVGSSITLAYVLSDGSNVSDTCRFNITVNTISDLAIIGGNNSPYCEGGELSLSVDTLAGASYQWTLPNGQFVNGYNLDISNLVREIHSGTYTLSCFISGSCSSSITKDIEVLSSPQFTADVIQESCGGSLAFEFNLETSSPPVDSVRWIGPNNFSSNQQEPTLDSPTSGTYTVTAYNGNCENSQSFEIDNNTLGRIEIFSDCGANAICVGDNCNLVGTTIASEGYEYNWSATEGCTINYTTDGNIATIEPQSAGSCELLYWISGNGCNSDTARITISSIAEPTAVDDVVNINANTSTVDFNVLENDLLNGELVPEVNVITPVQNGELSYNGNGVFNYVVGNNTSLNQFQYEVCYECDGSNLCSEAIVSIQLVDTSCTIPTLITPNGDGYNDELIINCLRGDEYNNAEMIIFNQWGDEVYRRKPYGNGVWWNGTYNDKPVTDGTYYFIFKLDDNSEQEKGYITVYR